MPTEQQQKVIDTHRGTLLIEACPGSGKTSTLVNRSKALPGGETKLVLAFNRKAADEFKHRLGLVPGCDVRTFDSFCMREVMGHPSDFGFKRKPTLAVEDDGRGRTKPVSLFSLMRTANGKEDVFGWDDCGWDSEFANTLETSAYDRELSTFVSTKQIRHRIEVPCDTPTEECTDASHLEPTTEWSTAIAVQRTRAYMIDRGLATFSSMSRLCAQNSQRLRFAAKHVMIDEYQDVNRFQFEMCCALAKINGVLSFAVVGDPNQRIYEWRGALASAFDKMREEFPEAETLPLTVNFRSVDPILEMAEQICPVGMTGVKGPGDKAVLIFDPDAPGALGAFLDGVTTDGYKESAILCRSNRECAQWQVALARDHKPVLLIGNDDFWRQKHIELAKFYRNAPDSENIFQDEEWVKITKKRVFRLNPEKLTELIADVKWILKLSDADMELMQKNLQREDGIRIATIHKTKGMEFDRVMISGISERLKQETFVYYVAVTRARNKLVLA